MIDLNQEKELITKESIYKHVTDVDIFQKYLDNGEEFRIGTAMISPLREESRPSFGFFMGKSNEVCFKDHVLNKAGDCFNFVQLKYDLTYYEALSKVAIDFDLSDKYICKNIEKETFKNTSKLITNRDEIIQNICPLRLAKTKRNWQLHDIVFWKSFGISIKTLEFFNVEPIEYVFINDKIIKSEKYAYCFIEKKDGSETYKIYQPYSKQYKWINGHNDSVWQGWDQLPQKGETLIITKSLKDVMSLYEVGENAISLQSENILPKRHVFEQLNQRFDECYGFYDNDFDKPRNWGKQFGDKICTEYGLIPIYIDDKYQCKDFSDLVKSVGQEQAKKILQWDMKIPF